MRLSKLGLMAVLLSVAGPNDASAEGERVEVELADGGIGAEEVMAAKSASGDHHGVAGEHEARLSHGRAGDA